MYQAQQARRGLPKSEIISLWVLAHITIEKVDATMWSGTVKETNSTSASKLLFTDCQKRNSQEFRFNSFWRLSSNPGMANFRFCVDSFVKKHVTGDKNENAKNLTIIVEF